jgi:sec-independent protein translocase protein TatC
MTDKKATGMSFLDHLEELRKRVFGALVAVIIGALVAYFFSGFLLDLLTAPVEKLVFLSPPEAFITRIKVALVAGTALVSPYIFYQVWRFIRPALGRGEARQVGLAVLFSTIFFLGGIAFALLLILPIGIKFLLSFETPRLEAMMSIDRYVSFATHILLAAGLVFQLPVVVFFLSRLGIVNPKMLRKRRRVAIVGIAILSALLTPPDIFTQLLMVAPLIVLYEISIFGSAIAHRARDRARAAAET